MIVFLALFGFFEAVMDKLQFHYDKSVFKSFKKQQFWDPKISWRNKWKEGEKENGERFLFSSTLLVFTTDAWHLAKFFRNVCLVLALFFTLKGGSLWELILGRILSGVVFEISFRNIFSE
jgi:hypothetical protein